MAESGSRTTIAQLGKDLTELGRIRFAQKYARPALVGVGRVAAAEEEENFAGRTMQVHIGQLASAKKRRGEASSAHVEATLSSVSDLLFIVPFLSRPIRVGRKAGINEIVIPDYSLSATHCELRWLTHESVAIGDVQSSNPIVVDGRPLEPKEVLPLKGAERIVLGRLIFRYFLPEQLVLLASGMPADSVTRPTG